MVHAKDKKLIEALTELLRAQDLIISSIEQKEESRGNESHVSTIKGYRSKIESELSNICDGILKFLGSKLIGSATSGDSKVFYLKMKGDYHRYLAEFKSGVERKEAVENTLSSLPQHFPGFAANKVGKWRAGKGSG
ncbi:14-3-3-like protein GF14 phi [Forsythia ovata]|uniref:14-3-3-like protein GF14 phi n=1 Tax=Forsythia ovata TaxID=205694 RepID=A0ABD1UW63_9LAMI